MFLVGLVSVKIFRMENFPRGMVLWKVAGSSWRSLSMKNPRWMSVRNSYPGVIWDQDFPGIKGMRHKWGQLFNMLPSTERRPGSS